MKSEGLLAWSAIVVLGGVSAGLGWWLGQRTLVPPEQPAPAGMVITEPGQLAPMISLPNLRTGEPVAVTGAGPVRLVNYWASWCGPCREEMPVLDAFAREQAGNGVKVMGIAMESREDALAFLAEVPVDFTLLLETPGPRDSSVQLGNRRGLLPFTVLIGADGRLLKAHYGAFPDVEAVQDWAQP